MKRTFIWLLALAMTMNLWGQARQRPGMFNKLHRPQSGQNGKADSSSPQPTSADAKSSKASAAASDMDWSKGVPLDIALQAYGVRIKKTILKDPNCPQATITFISPPGQKLTDEQQLIAIETLLEMNQVHLEPYGDDFMRALPRKEVRKEGIPLILNANAKLEESGRVVSMMIQFKNISTEDAQKALEGFKSASGSLIVFERTGSILATDTEQNINRMLEIKDLIDVPTPVLENVYVRQIRYSSAAEIMEAIQKIVEESMKEQEKNGKVNNNVQNNRQQERHTLFPRKDKQSAPANTESLVLSVSDADRGMIRGKVTIVPNERSNKLIFVTRKENMDFFDKVIEALDVETTPDTVVKVYRLKYADSEDVSNMINDLIGNSSSSRNSGKSNQNQNSKQGKGGNLTGNRMGTQSKTVANQRTGDTKAGELTKDNTTVLSDKRINGLVVMTNKELVPTVEKIIESMDIKLSQVLIETVIIEVTLGKDINTGIDWISGLRSGGNQALASGASSASLRTTTEGLDVGALVKDAISTVPAAQGIGYFANIKDLDISLIIQASKTDSRSKYLASPVIMTVDNKEATIDATTKQQFITGWQAVSSSYAGSGLPSPTYSSTDIGLKVKVTPKINPNGTVMLEVEEEYTQVAGKQDMLVPNTTSDSKSSYSTQQVEIPTTRKMSSDVLLENRQTVVFGGLIESLHSETEGGIPLLKDIPYIGKWLFGKVELSDTRTELLVFMTPYVLSDAEGAQMEAIRRKGALSDRQAWDDHGWSSSKLADPVSSKEQLSRFKDEWKKQDEERESRLMVEQAKIERAKELQSMTKEEREHWLELYKEEMKKKQDATEKMSEKDRQEQFKKAFGEWQTE